MRYLGWQSRGWRASGWMLALIWCGLLASSVQAEEVKNLYQHSVAVADQGESERHQAMSEALKVVLVRVSGRPQVLQSAVVEAAVKKPERYMDAFRYETRMERQEDEQVAVVELLVNFSRSSVEDLLRQAGMPLWPANRPAVLVWLVKDDAGEGRQLVSLRGDDPLAEAADQVALERGLPLIKPLLDLEDQLSANPDALWQRDQQAIAEASARYSADAVLVGRYSQTSSGRWLSTWTLFHKDRRQVFDSESGEESQLLADALAASSTYLAGIYGISTSGAAKDAVVMEIDQLGNFDTYIKALSYLEQLAVVRQLDVLSVDGSKVKVVVHMDGEVRSLTDALELDRRLMPVASAGGTGSQGQADFPEIAAGGTASSVGSEANPLRYRWP